MLGDGRTFSPNHAVNPGADGCVPVEATSADVRRRLAQLPVERRSQVVRTSPAVAPGLEESPFHQRVQSPARFVTAHLEDLPCLCRCDPTPGPHSGPSRGLGSRQHLEGVQTERFDFPSRHGRERGQFPVGRPGGQSGFHPPMGGSGVVGRRPSQGELVPERPVDAASDPLDESCSLERIGDEGVPSLWGRGQQVVDPDTGREPARIADRKGGALVRFGAGDDPVRGLAAGYDAGAGGQSVGRPDRAATRAGRSLTAIDQRRS